MRRSIWITLFLILVGVVVGSMAANVTNDISWLSWLSYGLNFGMENPMLLNLQVIKITLAISLNINISMVIFITLSLILGKLIFSNNY